MYDFEYAKPATLTDAKALMAREDAQALAGGQTLTPTMKQRLAQPSILVDLTGVAELKGVEASGDAITVKAATRHVDVATSPVIREKIPALAQLAGMIGDPAVRNRGTIGGSVANNDPSACYPAALMGLDATVATSNGRSLAAADFFAGLYSTTLDDGELVTAVTFKTPERAAWSKFPQPASRFSLVGVFVAKFADGVRVGVTGASEEGVFRHAGLEAALSANFAPDAVDGVAVSDSGMIEDLHGTPAYRAHLIKVMTKRAVAAIA